MSGGWGAFAAGMAATIVLEVLVAWLWLKRKYPEERDPQ